MSEHVPSGNDPDALLPYYAQTGEALSRYLPNASIQAETVSGTNVVSGMQIIKEQHIHLHGVPGQQPTPPLIRPRRAEHFHDRADEQAWLLANLHPGRVVTICGSGGMGKTALVAEILWALAPADTPPADFPHGIVFHSFYGQPEAAVALEQLARTFGEDPLPTPAQAAQRALSSKRTLLVLDGAEEAENLEQVLAVCANSAVLVTTRRRSDATDPALLLDLQRLPSDDAIAVVQAWEARGRTDEALIARICRLVGGLPLALRLVGSYLALHEERADEYLAWLQEDPFAALDQGSSSHKSVPLLLERSVARLRPDAQAVLPMIGLLALAPFERDLVAGVLELAAGAASRALGELVNYGLLVCVGKAYELSHPLIHTYARQVLLAKTDAAQQRTILERLITVLRERFPEVEYTNWPTCERLIPHIQACAAQLEEQGVTLTEAASLFYQAGDYLIERGKYEQAEPLLQRSLAIGDQLLGPDHPQTSDSLDRLATLYQYQRKYEQAEPLFQRALAIDEQALGPDHPHTSATLNNLALLYRVQRKYEQAEPLFQRALAIKEQVFGPNHPDTSITLNNLGLLYRDQGKYEQAEPFFQRALAIREQAFGPNHPDTSITLNNLAELYTAQGKYEQAETFYQRALAIKEQTLGPDHPRTATTLEGYAYLLRRTRRPEEAAPLEQRAKAIRARGQQS